MTLRAGQLASAAGVHRETLRYYERRGLLPRPDRSPGGQRLYSEDALTRLRVVKAAQRLGFTLEEIAELLDVRRRPSLHARATAKLAEVEQRLADLTTVRDALAETVALGCDDLAECTTQECCAFGAV